MSKFSTGGAKKNDITMVKNDEIALVPIRIQIGWKVCIDYRKVSLNARNDHFLLPFIDGMLEWLACYSYYYFLDGYLGYN